MNEPSPATATPSFSPETSDASTFTRAPGVSPSDLASAPPAPATADAAGRPLAVDAGAAEPNTHVAGSTASVPSSPDPANAERAAVPPEHSSPATPAAAKPAAVSDDDTAPEPSASPAPESTAESGANPAPTPEAAAEPPKIGVDIRFIDFAGKPIPDLQHKVTWMEKGKRLEFPGRTDAEGQGIKILSMEMHTRFELWIRKDDGSYVVKHRGMVDCENLSLCVVSPHIRIKVETELHAGSPGALPPKPVSQDASVEKRPNAPLTRASGGTSPEARLQSGRDAKGHPVATATVPSKDANDRHRLPTFALWTWKSFIERFRDFTMPAKVPAPAAPAAPVASGSPNHGVAPPMPSEASPRKPDSSKNPIAQTTQAPASQARTVSSADLKRVEKLIEYMEEQARWDWPALKKTYGSSAGIQNALAKGTFEFPSAQKSEKKFTGNCYASVKVGLWRAGFVEGVGGGISPSTEAKAWLESQGFVDVTKSLPDARWAEPGDVIVYEYDEATIKKNNEKIKGALEIYEQERKEYLEKKNLYAEEHAKWASRQSTNLTMLKEGGGTRKNSKDPEPKPPRPPQKPQGENYGHIDVRTYDGYISDAKTLKLANPFPAGGSSKGMVVNGIYRKISDPSVQYRVLAFLKCLREWECHEESDDAKRYYYLYSAIKGRRIFSDTSKHPFEGLNFCLRRRAHIKSDWPLIKSMCTQRGIFLVVSPVRYKIGLP